MVDVFSVEAQFLLLQTRFLVARLAIVLSKHWTSQSRRKQVRIRVGCSAVKSAPLQEMPGEKLAYNKQEPSFLRKLREEHGGPRNNVQISRPKKDRLRTGDEGEDDPVILDEAGENVAKEEWEGMLNREKEASTLGTVAETESKDELRRAEAEGESAREKQKVSQIGSTKKRKAGKVISRGEDAEHETKGDKAKLKEDKKAHSDELTSKESQPAIPPSKTTKKAKKIKLSFDEADG